MEHRQPGHYIPRSMWRCSAAMVPTFWTLLIPSSLEVSFGQDLKKTTDLTETTIYIRPKTTTRAVNCSSPGALTAAAGCATDELRLSLSGSVDGGLLSP